jgi:prepilin-type N-terminal cleavage/methylation domain-containing protein
MRKQAVTLIEMLVSIAIIATISASVVFSISIVERRRLEAATRTLVADLAWTRQLAVTQHQNYLVDFDLANDRYEIIPASGGLPPVKRRVLSIDLSRLAYVTAANSTNATWSNYAGTQIRFNSPTGSATKPDGTSFNSSPMDLFRAELTRGPAIYSVTVVGETGYVVSGAVNPPRVFCFIATAAYGKSRDEKGSKESIPQEVMILQRFKEQSLLTNELGKSFTGLYYATSPAVARYIAKREWAKQIVRLILDPIVHRVKGPAD